MSNHSWTIPAGKLTGQLVFPKRKLSEKEWQDLLKFLDLIKDGLIMPDSELYKLTAPRSDGKEESER